MSTRLESEYRAAIESWDWEGIVSDALSNPSESEEGEGSTGTAFLGITFALTPSGKYYLPFACSNLDTCETCGGHGKDYSQARACHICNGLGTRIARPEWNLAHFGVSAGESFQCNVCHGSGDEWDDCADCGGLGSSEAYQDEIWQAVLDETAQAHGGFIESSEGDACDIMFSIAIESDESELESEESAA